MCWDSVLQTPQKSLSSNKNTQVLPTPRHPKNWINIKKTFLHHFLATNWVPESPAGLGFWCFDFFVGHKMGHESLQHTTRQATTVWCFNRSSGQDPKEYNGMSQEFWTLLVPSLRLCFQTSLEASIDGDSCTSSSPWTKIPYQCLTSIHGWPSNLGTKKRQEPGPQIPRKSTLKSLQSHPTIHSGRHDFSKKNHFFLWGRKGAHFPLKHYDLVGLKC